jgi:hypothetical protein
MNDYSKKVEILAKLTINSAGSEDFADFIAYNDIGLPLAYAVHTDLATLTETGKLFIDETYNLLIEALGADPEKDYDSLEDLLGGLDND